MAQQLITQLIVVAALIYLLGPFVLPKLKRARVKPSASSCSGGCKTCPLAQACPPRQ